MALESTHILIAKEFANDLNVQDFDAYYSGTIYPDSKYLTNTERHLTHPVTYIINDELDDFTKGWYLHLLCDEVQGELFAHNFPKDIKTEQNTQWWYRFSAIKIIQDLVLFNKHNYQKELNNLVYNANPVGEDINLIKKYNKIIREFYTRDKSFEYNDYKVFWHEFDSNNQHLNPIFEEVYRILEYEGIEAKLLDLHEKLLVEMEKALNNQSS